MIRKPETEWIRHENAHEAIIEPEVWEAVQEKNRAVKQQVANHAAPLPALFTGKLVCADCGHPLIATRETQRRKKRDSQAVCFLYLLPFCYNRTQRLLLASDL